MFQIGNTIIGVDVIGQNFICDLVACKGKCCVEGESGAPLEDEEVEIIRSILPQIWADLSPEAKKIIESTGVAYKDDDGEMVTSIVDGKDCVFTYYDNDGICKCAIEKAYNNGKINFYKPISCHLYPIRLQKYKEFTAVNYHRWQICRPAVALGNESGVRVFEFLKEPLIRRFGEDWYQELSSIAEEYIKNKNQEK